MNKKIGIDTAYRQRLMTMVEVSQLEDPIYYGDKVICIGSCFSEHIGNYLYSLGYDIVVNPFGVQYNPLSIANVIDHLVGNKQIDMDELIYHRDLWHSMSHHGKFSTPKKEDTWQLIQDSLQRAKEQFKSLKFLFLTWGTSYVYTYKETDRVVANCHKLPEVLFDRQLLSLDNMLDCWIPLLEQLYTLNKNLRIITTISPIRHLRDGLHQNQISKSTLMLFDKALRDRYDTIYFPAYEIVQDELRDYRFYDRDLLHPSELTIDIIRQRFEGSFLAQGEENIRKTILQLAKQLAHRPLHSDSLEHQLRNEQLSMMIKKFANDYPNVCISHLI